MIPRGSDPTMIKMSGQGMASSDPMDDSRSAIPDSVHERVMRSSQEVSVSELPLHEQNSKSQDK